MARTFNCGIGAALVVSKDLTQQILQDIQQHKEEAWVIGRVVACPEGNCSLFSCSSVYLVAPFQAIDMAAVFTQL